jgi:hypothetical protein
MTSAPETCWYCGHRPAVVWCDHQLGSSLGVPKQEQLALGEVAPTPPEVVETCDAAACGPCRSRFGWRRVLNVHVRVGRGPNKGCHHVSVDRCHVHAEAGQGSAAWIGAQGIALARADVRAACRLTGGAT